MKEQLGGFSKIFSFTFLQHVRSKGYKSSTIVIALLCLLLPAVIMTCLEMRDSGGKEDIAEQAAGYEEQVADISAVKNILAVDLSDDKAADLSGLAVLAKQSMNLDIAVTDYGDDLEEARVAAKGSSDTLIVITEQQGNEYTMNIVLPENSGLSADVADGFDSLMMMYADSLSIAGGGSAHYYDDYENNGGTSENPMEGVDSIVGMIMSYLNVMLLYFFVLIYGQGVANSVVMEKSSKLMETFLVAVKPTAIILGKLMAITATGVLQLFSWIFSLGISFYVGTFAVKSINPETDMFIIQLFDFLKELTSGMFSPLNCIMAMLVVISGMLLYCALAGIGGAMAGKAEDLSSANMIFTLILVVSFLVDIYGGGLDGEAKPWLDWIPFTSVMITPSKILMGSLPLWKTLGSFAVTLITTLAATFAAGRIYKSLALYRGETLKPATLVRMLRSQR